MNPISTTTQDPNVPAGLDPTAFYLTKAIKNTETGGSSDPYNQTGKSGEFGAYQYMPDTWKSDASKYLGDPNAQMTQENQNHAAYNKVKDLLAQGYTQSQVASIWNSGKSDGVTSVGKGVNKEGVAYDVPGYVDKVKQAYLSYSSPSSNTTSPQSLTPTSGTGSPITNETTQPKNFLQKVGDFFTGSTQDFGNTAGQALAAGSNTDLYSSALNDWMQIDNNLKDAIAKKQQSGGDTTNLQKALTDHEESKPKQEDFTGDVIDKSNEQVLGEAGGAALEATSGGILSSGVETAGAKELSTGAKLLQGAKLGAAYGAVGGATSAMQQNQSLGNTAIGTAEGAGLGAALGTAGEAVGMGLNKAGDFIAKSNIVDKLLPESEQRIAQKANQVAEAKANIANEIKKSIPLTPTQLSKEEILFRKTGSNAFTTMAEYGVIPGQPDAMEKLDSVSDQYANAVEHAKDNEHGYFNVDQIKANAFNDINNRLSSETERLAAKDKITTELDSIIKANKDSVIKDVNNETKVKSDIVERLRKTGNAWGEYNKFTPDNVKNAAGKALANAVRDQVEKEGTFAGYREANKQWGQIIHAKEILQKVTDTGKPLRTMGGLSGAITRKFLAGTVGLHSAGLGGLVLSELGSEYGAKVLSDPQLKTYFDRKLIERFGEKSPTPEAVAKLEAEIRAHIDSQSKMLQLPAGDPSKIAIPMGAPAVKPTTIGEKMANDVTQNTNILNNTPQLPAPANIPRLGPDLRTGPNAPGIDYGTPQVGGMRQVLPPQ